MSSPRVVIRADSSALMGSGHVMRCLTLADELRRRGADVRFATREHPGHFIGRLDNAGYAVHRLRAPTRSGMSADHRTWLGVDPEQDAAETGAALPGGCDWLIVDHYVLDATWERELRRAAKRILVIDDLADRQHDTDVLLDQNALSATSAQKYAALLPAGCVRLLGPRYALLQPVYRHLRHSLPMRDGSVRRILVFFGGSDPSRSLSKVLEVLCEREFRHIAVDAVLGSDQAEGATAAALASARPGMSLHSGLPSLAALIARADVAVGAGGGTTWERSCLGLPSIVATIIENQAEIARLLATDESIVLLGDANHVDADGWRRAIRELVGDADRVRALERRSRRYTDGHGVARVAAAMLDSDTPSIRLRPALPGDESLLFEWANDPSVRRQAFSSQTIDPERHHQWFEAKLRDAGCAIMVAEDAHGLPVGQVRFDSLPDGKEALIDISIDVVMRGRGVGGTLLRDAVRRWTSERPGVVPIAEVLDANLASQNLFQSCGFRPIPARHVGSVTYHYPI